MKAHDIIAAVYALPEIERGVLIDSLHAAESEDKAAVPPTSKTIIEEIQAGLQNPKRAAVMKVAAAELRRAAISFDDLADMATLDRAMKDIDLNRRFQIKAIRFPPPKAAFQNLFISPSLM
jgi:hypothetical protein